MNDEQREKMVIMPAVYRRWLQSERFDRATLEEMGVPANRIDSIEGDVVVTKEQLAADAGVSTQKVTALISAAEDELPSGFDGKPEEAFDRLVAAAFEECGDPACAGELRVSASDLNAMGVSKTALVETGFTDEEIAGEEAEAA